MEGLCLHAEVLFLLSQGMGMSMPYLLHVDLLPFHHARTPAPFPHPPPHLPHPTSPRLTPSWLGGPLVDLRQKEAAFSGTH